MQDAYAVDPELTDLIQSSMSSTDSWYALRRLRGYLEDEGVDLTNLEQILSMLEEAGFLIRGMHKGEEAIKPNKSYDWPDTQDMYESVRRKKTKRTTKRK